MTKKSKRRLGRREKDQSGCMWSLINIFDFRHVHSSQKLLLDMKRGSRRLDGIMYDSIKLELLSDSCELCSESNDNVQNETTIIDTSKTSVKELMEEEMCSEKDRENPGSIACDDKASVKKNRRWTRNKMSLDLEADGFVVADDLVERPTHRKHKSCSSVDLNKIVEELCSQIQQKDPRVSKRCEDGKPIRDSVAVEKQLAEAAKVLVKHFTDGKTGTIERKIQPSKDLTGALQMLNSNKDVFLKLLQDPDSQLVKHLQSLQDIHVEEGKFNVLTGTDSLEQDIGVVKQPNFFWRRFNGQERNSSRKSDTSVDLSRIVVLKPGARSSKNSDVASTCSSLPESPKSAKDKDENQKSSSPFTFAELKRKLKHVMRKQQRDVSHQPSEMQPNLANRDKKVGGENVGIASPSRDHFLNDRIPKTSVSFRKVDKTGKLKDGKIQLEHVPGLTPEQRISSIYIEAKRHLAEIVENSDLDFDAHGRKVPKSLGRILSYSGYNSPTVFSPRTDADVRLSSYAECQTTDEKSFSDLQEINVNLPSQVKQEPEAKSCIEEEIPALESLISDGLHGKSDVDKPVHNSELLLSEDTMRAFDAAPQKESNSLEVSDESCPSEDVIKTEQVDWPMCSEESSRPSSPEQNTGEEKEHSSCPDSSTLNCSLSGKMEDVDAMSDATSRPSPVSVLEPIFIEDEISPTGIKFYTANEHIQPRQIKFEEEFSVHIGRVPSSRTRADHDKYTFEFVKQVVQLSGLTWDELLRRSLFSDHLIDPSLIDEVDFLPDLLSCDFNLLFDLINEVVIELCWLNFGCTLSLTTPFVQLSLKGKPIYTEVWKGVNTYLTLEAPLRTLDQIVGKDFGKPGVWVDLRLDSENIGIQIQEAVLDELVEDTISSCLVLLSAEEDAEIMVS
ncbi:hypothetical protein RND81_03G210900 [Saponaria officinalis]|uniref:Uncharacterized protein n=2 Tax=Saponaria officinalis TaxID=3572 RepID=A0AAW1M1Q5_SAPOF